MFRPQYRYTRTLVENLLQAENGRAIVDAVSLPESAARELRARTQKAHQDAARALDGSIPPDFAKALSHASAGTSSALDEAFLQSLCAALGNGGAYRRSTKLLYDTGRTELIYIPPEAEEVPRLMAALVGWLTESWELLPAVILAGVAHQELLLIQPFEGGNGTLARLAGHAVLCRKGYSLRGYATAQAVMSGDPHEYERASRSTHTGVHSSQADFTSWLEYFSGAVAEAAREARDEVMTRAKRPESPAAADLPVILRDRQLKALHYIRENGAIRSGEYQRLVGIVPDTARRDFDELMDKGLIEVRGVGRGTHYVLTRRGVEEAQRRRPA
jgi:Fic family protein